MAAPNGYAIATCARQPNSALFALGLGQTLLRVDGMRLAHGAFFALFVFAASLQLNDADPARWITMYLAAALACALGFFRHRLARPAAILVGVVALVWSLTYLPSVLRHGQILSMFDEWTMRNQEVLENREMFGLLIVAAIMAWSAWALGRKGKRGRTSAR